MFSKDVVEGEIHYDEETKATYLDLGDGNEVEIDPSLGAIRVDVPEVTSKGYVVMEVDGSDVKVGDRLDRSGRTRISKVHDTGDRVLIQAQTQGSNSPTVAEFDKGRSYRVYRPGGADTPTATPEAPEGTSSALEDAAREDGPEVKGSRAYKAAYARGYKASQRFGSGGSLERADDRNEPKAWYDGYHDHATDRPRWLSMKLTPEQIEAYDRGEVDENGNALTQWDRDEMEHAAGLAKLGFTPVTLEQRAKDEPYYYGMMGKSPVTEEESDFPINFSLAAEDAMTNALDQAVDEGFATKREGDWRGQTIYEPVPPISELELEHWTVRQAAAGIEGILDGYGYDHDGELYDFNKRNDTKREDYVDPDAEEADRVAEVEAVEPDPVPEAKPKPEYVAAGDVQLTQRSSGYFDSLISSMNMWDGPGLVDAYDGNTGNLTDLKMKGLVTTNKSDRASFVYLTPKGLALAESRHPEWITGGMRDYGLVNDDGTFPTRPVKELTPEEIAKRSRPPLTGLDTGYLFGSLDPNAKVKWREQMVRRAGDDQLWAALAFVEELAERDQSPAALKRIPQMKQLIEGEIKFRYLADPALAERLEIEGVDISISPEDYRSMSVAARGRFPTDRKQLEQLLVRSGTGKDWAQRIRAALNGESVDEGTPEPSTTPSPSAAPGAPKDRLSAARQALEDQQRPYVTEFRPAWVLEGDVDSGLTMVQPAYTVNGRGEPEKRRPVYKNEAGAWTYDAEKGRTGQPLFGWMPEVAKILRGDDPPAYNDRLEAYKSDPSAYGNGPSSWPQEVIYEFVSDYKLPSKPTIPLNYGKSVRDGGPSQKEMTAYSDAVSRWDRLAREYLDNGGPPTIGVRATPDSPTHDIEAELDRLTATATLADEPRHRVQDKKGAYTKLDNYVSDVSAKEVQLIQEAAAPLRAEMLRRLSEEIQDQSSGDYDADRWDPAKERGHYTDDAPGGAGLSGTDWDKARNAYVGNDVQTIQHNRSLRSAAPSTAAKSWRGRMNRMVNSTVAEDDMVTYRGVALPPALLRKLTADSVLEDPGIVSTDSSEGSALGYLQSRIEHQPGSVPVLLELLVPKGHPVADVMYGEFVLGSNDPMRVRAVRRMEDGTYRITVELGTGREPGPVHGVTAGGSAEGGAHVRDGGGVTDHLVAGLRVRVHGGAG